MEFRQIRYVLAVAETRNFTRAAAQCYVAQSALSHQVRSLERELGVPLFARTSRRVELTPAGEAFLPAARRCLAEAERAATEAAAAVGEVRGRLAIGIIPTVAAVDIPATLQRFRDQHPRVRVSLRVGASHEMSAAVAAGDLDVAFLGLPVNDRARGVSARELARQDLVAVVPAGHPCADQGTATLQDLATSPFADFPAGSPGRSQSDEAFAAAKLERDVAYEVSSAELMVQIVSQGLAVAFLPAPIVRTDPGIRVLTVADGPSRIEHLIWSEFNPAVATRAFLAVLELDEP
ncbi:LysR family transcriptional regulator [Ruania rhizosphaerae]|uniref:LysR family transcriptional regulator n=1 Tax=Ruania rhizosphaerae TaxID=1840413 RepID=UPI00135AA9B0|nr:LysR family transcriptional regulator [Ruania rhizosphaerae]